MRHPASIFGWPCRTIKENLQVEAQAPLVETETSEQGLVVGGQMIGDLPLNGRDFLRLARLAPGVFRRDR